MIADNAYNIKTFGGDTWYPDDMAFIAYLLDTQWSLGVEEHPGFVYHDERGLVRDNGPDGRGSIYVYDLGYVEGPITGINYESEKYQHNLGISVLNKDKIRHMRWVNEIIDILDYYRRAGVSDNKRLNGWSYMGKPSKKKTSGMTDYYGTTIDLYLRKEVKRLPYDGYANIPRKEYLKVHGNKGKKK